MDLSLELKLIILCLITKKECMCTLNGYMEDLFGHKIIQAAYWVAAEMHTFMQIQEL